MKAQHWEREDSGPRKTINRPLLFPQFVRQMRAHALGALVCKPASNNDFTALKIVISPCLMAHALGAQRLLTCVKQ